MICNLFPEKTYEELREKFNKYGGIYMPKEYNRNSFVGLHFRNSKQDESRTKLLLCAKEETQ